MSNQKRGYDDASIGAFDSSMKDDSTYILGQREYMLKRLEWAHEDLEAFDQEHINSNPTLVEQLNIDLEEV